MSAVFPITMPALTTNLEYSTNGRAGPQANILLEFMEDYLSCFPSLGVSCQFPLP